MSSRINILYTTSLKSKDPAYSALNANDPSDKESQKINHSLEMFSPTKASRHKAFLEKLSKAFKRSATKSFRLSNFSRKNQSVVFIEHELEKAQGGPRKTYRLKSSPLSFLPLKH